MSAELAEISFSDLLAANEAETQRWRVWFDGQPAAILDVPLSIAGAKNVREFLLHIFAVELRYAERLAGLPMATATDEDLASVMEFPTRTVGVIRASKRKMFAHAMLHGVRHWAQLATALREAGNPTNWGKDFLYSPVME
jgi:uncharacterized damage-inducible protein DinB